ncbi:hypothetical protein K443DRAFT_116613, partial [Laccaria amethystina LaAM-08-1]
HYPHLPVCAPPSLPPHLAPSLWPTRTKRTVPGPFRWNPAPRPINEDPAPLSKPTPTLQPVKTLAPPVRRLPLCPTQPRLPRPHVDTQMRPNSAVNGEDSW